MLYRGDDTNAFDRKFLKVSLKNADGLKIKRAELTCSGVKKTFENPVFPLWVDLCCDETKILLNSNCAHLALYDEHGRKHTCKGEIIITTKREVV